MHIIIISAGLLILGIFFPPAWLGLTGYVIYVGVTRKGRRTNIIETYLSKMMVTGQTYAVFGDLYFEAARSYAEDHGGRVFPEDTGTISADILLNGEEYRVGFVKQQSGGTAIIIGGN